MISFFFASHFHLTTIRLARNLFSLPLCKFYCSCGSAEADRKKCIEHTFVAIRTILANSVVMAVSDGQIADL